MTYSLSAGLSSDSTYPIRGRVARTAPRSSAGWPDGGEQLARLELADYRRRARHVHNHGDGRGERSDPNPANNSFTFTFVVTPRAGWRAAADVPPRSAARRRHRRSRSGKPRDVQRRRQGGRRAREAVQGHVLRDARRQEGDRNSQGGSRARLVPLRDEEDRQGQDARGLDAGSRVRQVSSRSDSRSRLR